MVRRLLIIGLDSATPELVFRSFANKLPNIHALMREGSYVRLRSCDPPITIPAWMVMMTGRDPGEIGLYGFRSRKPGTYNETVLPSSHSVSFPKLWDFLGDAGFKSCVIGVPPTYPPQKLNGSLVSCFMTPSSRHEFTYPSSLKQKIQEWVGEYIFDVVFRKEDRDQVLRSIYEMTEKRFTVAGKLLKEENWDLFILMEIGLDRVHHAFWKYFDQSHHLYEKGNRYEKVIEDYYKYLDSKIGELLSLVSRDTDVLIVSDHGAKRMKGAFCVNQWLADEGYLHFRSQPKGVTEIEKADIDWSRTIAWGWGGYYARIFINLEDREPHGIVKKRDYDKVRDELTEALRGIRGSDGERWDTKVFRPEEIYRELRWDPPDLLVYFDDLFWRAAGTVGHGMNYLPENDTGPDDAVHDYDGIFIYWSSEYVGGPKDGVASIYDVAPTLLSLFRIKPPANLRGNSLF
jgi:predicted AlkP superfamily phosphohydrolase/phosphomutase